MSAWGKYLWPIVVPTGGWDFDYNLGGAETATIPAGTYETINELLDELEDQCEANGDTWTLSTTEAGVVQILSGSDWTWTAASTDDDLEAVLGLGGSESVSSKLLTSTDPHTHGWYPGTISRGASDGIGDSGDGVWHPRWPEVTTDAGSTQRRRITPTYPTYARGVIYDVISRAELLHASRGYEAMLRGAFAQRIRYYHDRAIGCTAGGTGTEGNPHTAPLDSSCDYWTVMLEDAREPERREHPDYFRVSMVLLGQVPA